MKLMKFYEFLLESKVSIELPFIVSSDILDKFQRIESPIANKLTEMALHKTDSPCTLLLSSDSNDMVKYIDSYRLDLNIKTFDVIDSHRFLKHYDFNPSCKISIFSNTEIKIGRLVKKIFGNEFSDSEIEKFVNQYKSINDDDDDDFKLWSGIDIKKAYISRNYLINDHTQESPLGNSCMNDCLDLIDFYKYCSVRVLVLLDKDKKILGRALVWKDTEGRFVMDRVYYIYDKDYYKFFRYAKESGFYYKAQNISGIVDIYYKDNDVVSLESKVKIPNIVDYLKSYGEYPYMDTYIYGKGEYLYNHIIEAPFYKFIDTEGAYDYII